MSDYLADTPIMSESWCPRCEPDRDEMKEILEVRWCAEHWPERAGSEDDKAGESQSLSGTADTDPHTARELAKLIR